MFVKYELYETFWKLGSKAHTPAKEFEYHVKKIFLNQE